MIGISEYSAGWPKLSGVEDDIVSVEKALVKQGFNVEVVRNLPNKNDLESAFEDFIFKYGLETENRLLIYFAGHGYTHKPPYASEDPEGMDGIYSFSRCATAR